MQRRIHGCINMMNIFDNNVYQEQLKYQISYLPEKDKIFLITGASGLIGSCLTDCLMYANIYEGRHFDVYVLGRSEEKMRKRFNYAKERNDLHFIVADVSLPLPDNVDFDYIFHAASNADPISYALFPSETLLTNILGTKSVLDYAKEHKRCRILLTSTFEVYGDGGKNGVLTEDSFGAIDFHKMRNSYPASKVCAELLCQGYGEQFGVDYVIGRLCGIYGPTMSLNDSKAQAQFIKNAVCVEDIVMKSKGEQIRSYCYVIDAVSALLTVMMKGKTAEAYNIADEKSIISIAEFAKCVAEVGGVGIRFDLPDEIEAKGFSKPVDVVMENTKLKSLGWQSKHSCKEGILSTIQVLRGVNTLK